MKLTYRQKYDELQEMYKECSAVLSDALESNRLMEKKLYYFEQFISYKGLEDEYYYFKENAHEAVEPDNPFPPLIL